MIFIPSYLNAGISKYLSDIIFWLIRGNLVLPYNVFDTTFDVVITIIFKLEQFKGHSEPKLVQYE